MENRPSSSILWQQVWGLAILQSAITFSWLAYHFAQPIVLQQTGYFELSALYYVVSGLLSLIIEPSIGHYSDRVQQKLGSRFPIINMGVILTAMIFLTIALGFKITIPESLSWIFPFMMVFWIASMKIFQTPAASLLWRYAPPKDLPQANSIIIFCMFLTGALGPFINRGIREAGFALTFTVGGVVLMISLFLLRKLTPTFVQADETTGDNTSGLPTSVISRIFIVGFCASMVTLPIYYIAPSTVQSQFLPSMELEYIAAGILLFSALAAIPLGRWASQYGMAKALLTGIALMTVFLGLSSFDYITSPLIKTIIGVFLITGIGILTGLIYNTGFPWALTKVPGEKASLGTGIFFGGGGAAYALLSAFALVRPITTYDMFVGGMILTLVAYYILVRLENK